MKKIILLLVLFVQEAIASSSLTENSFNGVVVGESASSALKKLKGYREEKHKESDSCYYLSDSANIKSASFMVIDGVIVRIEVLQGQQKIQTSKGITVGSSKSDVLAKYKSVQVSPHPYIAPEGEYLEVKLNNGLGIIFETSNDIVTRYRLGSYPAITYIEGCL